MTQTILIAVVATIGAILAIGVGGGVGGGMVRPRQDRWERMLTVAERETNAHAGGDRSWAGNQCQPTGNDLHRLAGVPAGRPVARDMRLARPA